MLRVALRFKQSSMGWSARNPEASLEVHLETQIWRLASVAFQPCPRQAQDSGPHVWWGRCPHLCLDEVNYD